MADDILGILGDPPEFFQPLPEGVERRKYEDLTLEQVRDTLNHLYDVNRLLAAEVTRQRTVIVLGLTKIKWLRRITAGAFTMAAAAWTPLWLPLFMKWAGLK